MKSLKKIFSVLLTVIMLLAVSVPAFAAEAFSDVASGIWYADAVSYVSEHGLMTGTGSGQFSPEAATELAMVLSILHRDAGTPAAVAAAPEGASGWYADAAAWASERGYLADINAAFTGTPITREDLVTVLWRYADSPEATAEAFADAASVSPYAAQAAAWARANGIINGKTDNLFAPKDGTTRAELAVILQSFLSSRQTAAAPAEPTTDAAAAQPTTGGKTLVAYFSASGNTKAVAETIASALNADIFEITPAPPYTREDLDWTADSSRVNREHDNESLRAVELTRSTVDGWDSYDTVFIGYPIWWGIAAWPVDSFVKANDFTGKTVIPFCTSSSSGLGQSGELLAQLAGTGEWKEGRRFGSSAQASAVTEWLSSLGLNG